ncbi:hypothetical protein M0R45_000084 [Rubus argutus]|uniref:Uncharacterized protein n=1 Tax=Rubus argutus TaxID=59490 RepID=A0AAW1VQ75_RUBAR
MRPGMRIERHRRRRDIGGSGADWNSGDGLGVGCQRPHGDEMNCLEGCDLRAVTACFGFGDGVVSREAHGLDRGAGNGGGLVVGQSMTFHLGITSELHKPNMQLMYLTLLGGLLGMQWRLFIC